MKPSIAILGVLAYLSGWFASDASGAPANRENLHVYLLIGQSNMAGRAPLEGADTQSLDRVLLLNQDNAWEPAQSPLNRYSTIRKGLGMQKLGPGHAFAQAMVPAQPGVTIGLVVNARGGSRIEEWTRDGKYYQEALKRVRAAQASGTLKGILWHQGESNANQPDGYLDKLSTLIANLREDLGAPTLPFVAGQVHNVPAINDQIAKLPATVPHTGFAGSEGLTAMDRWHFDAKSCQALGQRYAEQMLKLQGRN